MTDLMETLYSYAQESTILSLLALEKDYQTVSHCAETQEQLVRVALSKDGTGHLDAMLEELELISFIEERAAFQAGFRLALELTR